MKSGLLVCQFAIAAGLLATSVFVDKQLAYIATRDLGYDPDQVLALTVDESELALRYPALRASLMENGDKTARFAMLRLPCI